jgi:hypothetical protein
MWGACAVSFEVELAFQRLVDRLDPLARSTEVVAAESLVLAVWPLQSQARVVGESFEVVAGESFVGQQDLAVLQKVVVVFEQGGQHLAFTDLGGWPGTI